MTAAHIALIIVGTVGLAESTWGICAPLKLKAAVEKVVDQAPTRNIFLAGFFLAASIGFWLLMSPDHRPSDWALLVMSWIFAGGTLVNLKANGVQDLIEWMILRRSAVTIRLIYVLEFALACLVLGIGVSAS